MFEKCEPGKVFKNWAEFKEAHKDWCYYSSNER